MFLWKSMENATLIEFLTSALGDEAKAEQFATEVLAQADVYTVAQLHQSFPKLKRSYREIPMSRWTLLECAFNESNVNNLGNLPTPPTTEEEEPRRKGMKPDLTIDTTHHYHLSHNHLARLAQNEDLNTTERTVMQDLQEGSQEFMRKSKKEYEEDRKRVGEAAQNGGETFKEDQKMKVEHLRETHQQVANDNDSSNQDSRRGSLSAGDEIALLKKEDITLISQLLQNQLIMISEEALKNIRSIFDRLDVDGDGVLSPYDFQDEVPIIGEIKQKMWFYLLDYFDYNEDACIEYDEFKQWFILRTLKSPFKMPTVGLTFGQIILKYREQFEKVLNVNIMWLQTNLLYAYEEAVLENSEKVTDEEANEE